MRSLAALAGSYRGAVAAALASEPSGGETRRLRAAAALDELLRRDGLPAQLLEPLLDEMVGLGPLQELLNDPGVTEVMINGPHAVFVEREGRLQPASTTFRDGAHLAAILERLLAFSGRRLDRASPVVDARTPDGGRINAVLAPVGVEGPLVTIRRPSPAWTLDRLLERGAMTRTMAAFLHAAVLGRANLLVSGPAGAGKTSLLAALAALVPHDQRLVCIEDVAELRIDHPHVVRQETRPTSRAQSGVSVRDLVRNTLRMRPDRIVVGEVRGEEAADMVMAMSTGHSGSLATVHSSSPGEALDRMEAMMALAWSAVDAPTLRRWLGGALDVVVHCARSDSGMRTVATVAAVHACDEGLQAVPLFTATERGCFRAHGHIPQRCLDRMAANGVSFPSAVFSADNAA
jgi:pilus assembly protein CpaF